MKLIKLKWANDRISLLWPDHPLLMAGDKSLEFVIDCLDERISNKNIASKLASNTEFNLEETTAYVNQITNALQESGVTQGGKHQQLYKEGEEVPSSNDLAMATLNLTRKCNLKCNHCYAEGGNKQHKKEIPIEELPIIIDRLSKIITRAPRLFIISGGEPTIERDKLEVAVAEASKNGLNVRLNTNGFFMDDTLAAFLAEHKALTQVSLDGINAETNALLRGRLDAHEVAVKAIKKLVNAGCRTRISFTVHSANYLQLPDMISFAQNLGVEQFTTSSLVGLGSALKNDLQPIGFNKEFTTLYRAIQNSKEKQRMTRSTLLAETITAIRAGVRFTYCGTGCCTCCIDSDGNLYPCINMVRKGFSAGNVIESEISALWEDSPIFKQLRLLNVDTMNESCKNCAFRYFCGGYCRGETIESGKKITDPYVRCASWKRGLTKIMDFLSETPDLYDFGEDPLIGVFHRE